MLLSKNGTKVKMIKYTKSAAFVVGLSLGLIAITFVGVFLIHRFESLAATPFSSFLSEPFSAEYRTFSKAEVDLLCSPWCGFVENHRLKWSLLKSYKSLYYRPDGIFARDTLTDQRTAYI